MFVLGCVDFIVPVDWLQGRGNAACLPLSQILQVKVSFVIRALIFSSLIYSYVHLEVVHGTQSVSAVLPMILYYLYFWKCGFQSSSSIPSLFCTWIVNQFVTYFLGLGPSCCNSWPCPCNVGLLTVCCFYYGAWTAESVSLAVLIRHYKLHTMSVLYNNIWSITKIKGFKKVMQL